MSMVAGGIEEVERGNARNYFDMVTNVFDLLDFNDAAEKLRYYRSGQGGQLVLSDKEMARHPAYGEAVDENRTRFESRTFTGTSKKGKTMEELLAIPDGGTARLKDSWDRNIEKSDPSTYLNFGRFALQSGGDFEVSRKGNQFTLKGVVDHRLGAEDKKNQRGFVPERFDFNDGQPGKMPANVAERYGDAAPFDMVYPNRQRVDARVVYDPTRTSEFPDGRFVVEQVDWSPLGESSGGGGWRTPDWNPFAAKGELAFDP